MKKIIKLFLIFLSVISFSNIDNLNDVLIEKEKVIKGERELSLGISGGDKVRVITTGVISPDEILLQLGTLSFRTKISDLYLIFPDNHYLNRYIENTSRVVDNVYVYLLDKKTNEKYLEYRDYDSFINKSIDKKIENLSNVVVYTVFVSKED